MGKQSIRGTGKSFETMESCIMCRMKSLQKSTGDTQHLISTSELITCEPGAPVPFLILFCQANGIKETMWAATMHLSC